VCKIPKRARDFDDRLVTSNEIMVLCYRGSMALRITLTLCLVVGLTLSGCTQTAPTPKTTSVKPSQLTLTSSSVAVDGLLAQEHTCNGNGTSPALTIDGVPDQTRSLAISLTDPDASAGTFTHWTVWNIDPKVREISAGNPPNGATQGLNDFRRVGFGPACPPRGQHNYVFTLFALDAMLELPSDSTPEDFQDALAGHIIAQTSLTAHYQQTNP
jgi:Raf kinase inhibitor-like YbhB/YbcL family protein